jgi:hypothetical protein
LASVTLHVFVDESERSSYVLCAASVAAGDLVTIRRRLRGLRRPGSVACISPGT